MENLKVEYRSAHDLRPNPFNPNRIDPQNLERLRNSLGRLGTFKPVLARTLDDGSYEVLGGYHRTLIAQERDEQVPVINLGALDDQRAKEIALADNLRSGVDDPMLFADLLRSMDIDLAELSTFLPGHYEEIRLDLSTAPPIDLDTLGLDNEESADAPGRPVPTHTTLRFRVPLEDAERISALLQQIIHEQGFEGGSSAENAGDALTFLLLGQTDEKF